MNLDFKKLGEFLSFRDLWGKPLCIFSQNEIVDFCNAIWEATDPGEGWTSPYLDKYDQLVIPYNSPIKYRWWQGGQPISDTILELTK